MLVPPTLRRHHLRCVRHHHRSDIQYETGHAAAATKFVLRRIASSSSSMPVAESDVVFNDKTEAGFEHDLLAIHDDFPGEKYKGKAHRYRRGGDKSFSPNS